MNDSRVTATNRHPRWTARALVLTSAPLLGLTLFAAPAAAHGSVVDPATRNYGCFDRWGDDHQNPDMAEEDPMCWQAWEDDPNAMWNWNGLYQNEVGGDHEAAAPDGNLCSGGLTYDGRYAAMDAVGEWETTPVDSEFTVHLHDGAVHGADNIMVYVTQDGFDPTTDELTWADLGGVDNPVTETGSEPEVEDHYIDVSVDGDRSGHHIVFTVWEASHMDQVYYMCSDVDFG